MKDYDLHGIKKIEYIKADISVGSNFWEESRNISARVL